MIVAGCDIGAFTGKSVILENGTILSSAIVPLGSDTEETAKVAMEGALKGANLTFKDIVHITATGFGEVDVSFAQNSETETSWTPESSPVLRCAKGSASFLTRWRPRGGYRRRPEACVEKVRPAGR